jgi:hypothetical protein
MAILKGGRMLAVGMCLATAFLLATAAAALAVPSVTITPFSRVISGNIGGSTANIDVNVSLEDRSRPGQGSRSRWSGDSLSDQLRFAH